MLDETYKLINKGFEYLLYATKTIEYKTKIIESSICLSQYEYYKNFSSRLIKENLNNYFNFNINPKKNIIIYN